MPKKAGVEWVKNYAGKYPYLVNSGFNAQGFLNTLTGTGGTGVLGFEFGDTGANGLARGQHLEQQLAVDTVASRTGASDSPTADSGEDDDVAETVDILYFSGHGTYDRLFFGGSDLDDSEAWNTEMQLGGTLKWFIADACDVLTTVKKVNDADFGNDVRLRWRRIFHGLRYMLGFHGTCSDVHNRGAFFAQHLNLRDTVRHAWELACEESEHNEGMPWAYLRAGNAASGIKNDRWTDETFVAIPTDVPPAHTYVRNIPPPVTT